MCYPHRYKWWYSDFWEHATTYKNQIKYTTTKMEIKYKNSI